MKRLRVLVALVIAIHAVAFIWVVVGRMSFPFELEWMTGAVRDHVERVRAGQPLYVRPSSGFIPFLYPPLYYWVAAAFGGSVFACRAISLAATLVQGVACQRIAVALGADRFWSYAASGLFIASFSYVGFWYDLERCDSLLGGLVVAAAWLLVSRPSAARALVAGLLLGAAFLAKQQAIFYLAGAGAGLLLATRATDALSLRHVLAFAAAAAVSLFGGIALARAREGEAFVYYVLAMPRAHGIMPVLIRDALARDFAIGFAPVLATIAFTVLVGRSWLRRTVSRAEIVFGSMLAAGFAGAIASRLHIGGWINVLIPWTTFASIAMAVVASRMKERRAQFVSVALVVQLCMWLYDPNAYVPPRAAKARHARFAAMVHAYEEQGPVLVPARGHVARGRHFHVAALADTARVDGGVPEDLRARVDGRVYAAIFDDARPKGETAPSNWPPILLEDFPDLGPALLRSYYIAEWVPDDLVRIQLAAPALPHWVYRPRTVPLPIDTPRSALRQRQLEEMRLAFQRAMRIEKGQAPAYTAAEIETLAGHH
jgi:hypothetical protein